jgi:hypothetical protein
MAITFYKTSEAVYHNKNNINLKLLSFEFVSQNLENALFTKRVIADKYPAGKSPFGKGRDRGILF